MGMVVLPLDIIPDAKICIGLFREVKDTASLKESLAKGAKCCMVKPNLIVDIFQVQLAGAKALLNEKCDWLSTKSVFSELIYGLSPTKSISDSLKLFGISEDDTDVLLITFDEISFEIAAKQIQGDLVEISQLADLVDSGAIRKAYKIDENELKTSTLLESVVSKMAIKEIGNA